MKKKKLRLLATVLVDRELRNNLTTELDRMRYVKPRMTRGIHRFKKAKDEPNLWLVKYGGYTILKVTVTDQNEIISFEHLTGEYFMLESALKKYVGRRIWFETGKTIPEHI